MTWKEFKAAVEALGVTDDHELGFIDLYDEPEVFDINANDGRVNLTEFMGSRKHGKTPTTVAEAVRR